jgi:hypothetical protein
MDVIQKALAMRPRDLIAFCATDQVSKNDLGYILQDLAQGKREKNETPEQAFSRFITSDEIGKSLFRLHQQSAGGEEESGGRG